jgi:hypothetical protein
MLDMVAIGQLISVLPSRAPIQIAWDSGLVLYKSPWFESLASAGLSEVFIFNMFMYNKHNNLIMCIKNKIKNIKVVFVLTVQLVLK